MTALRFNIFLLLCLTASILLWERSSFSETTIAEQVLSADRGLLVDLVEHVHGAGGVVHAHEDRLLDRGARPVLHREQRYWTPRRVPRPRLSTRPAGTVPGHQAKAACRSAPSYIPRL